MKIQETTLVSAQVEIRLLEIMQVFEVESKPSMLKDILIVVFYHVIIILYKIVFRIKYLGFERAGCPQ
jgi:hypothetical protein